MSKYVNLYEKSAQPPKGLEEFNLKIYRERLNDKYAKSPASQKFDVRASLIDTKSLIETKSPIKLKQSSGAPTFDNLQGRLRDYSFTKLKNTSSETFLFSKIDKDSGSPSRITGMQSKIHSIGNNLVLPQKQSRQASMYSGPITDDRHYIKAPVSPIKPARFETESSSLDKSKHGAKAVSVMVPLHEIVNLRNKFEQATINVAHLTPTYTSEMVKLAQIITTKLKRQ